MSNSVTDCIHYERTEKLANPYYFILKHICSGREILTDILKTIVSAQQKAG